jgi:hypothetical protein
MCTRRAFAVLSVLGLACSHAPGEVGRPEALRPILGSRSVMSHVPRTQPSEPVENLLVQIGPLRAAWPEVAIELPRLIQTLIARGSWTDEHHRAVEEDGAILVRHRPQVLAQVRTLMRDLQARLPRVIQLQIAFVEVGHEAASQLASGDLGAGWGETLERLTGGSQARVLAQAQLTGGSGQWLRSEMLDDQTVLAGYSLAEGAILPRKVSLASGYTVQAAAWRWGEERAVVALTGLYTGEGAGGPVVSQPLFRELPRQKDAEHQWEQHEAKLAMPVRELVEVRGQVIVPRGRWRVVGSVPVEPTRLCAALVRVDWAAASGAPERPDPLSGKGFVLDIIPVSIPIDAQEQVVQESLRMDNGKDISSSAEVWFRSRAKHYQEMQQEATVNFQFDDEYIGRSGMSQVPQAKSSKVQRVHRGFRALTGGDGQGSDVVTPTAALAELRQEVMQADWPEGTALEFVANHVFVVHTPEMTGKVRRLLEKTHELRNRQVAVDVGFPALAPGLVEAGGAAADGARDKGTRDVARGSVPVLPAARLFGRVGTWTELFAGEMHGLLGEAWAPNRPSPAMVVYWRGTRLGARPEISDSGGVSLNLRLGRHRLDRAAPETKAGAFVPSQTSGIWSFEQALDLLPGTPVLLGARAVGAKRLEALEVRASF